MVEEDIVKKVIVDNTEMETVVVVVAVVVVVTVLEPCMDYLDNQVKEEEEDTVVAAAVDAMDTEVVVDEVRDAAVPASFHDDRA